jgi:ClpP class serine protease
MRFQHIIEHAYHRPWMITREGLSSVHQLIHSKLSGDVKALDFSEFVNGRRELEIVAINGVQIAHIDIRGVLAPRMTAIERSCGNTDYLQIAEEIKQAKEQGAQAILYTVDSPGGSCTGSIECALAIQDSGLPSAAAVEAQCCSAAYMQIASCARIFAPQSSMVGSIGTIIARIDASGAWEKLGIKSDCITNDEGDLKDTGHAPALNDEQRAYLKEIVNDAFAQFRGHVENHRAIEKWAMRGQAMFAPRALEANLIDEIGGLDEARAWLVSQIAG